MFPSAPKKKLKVKILLVIEALLALGTVISYFATVNASDFSGFLVAYFIIALIIFGIVILIVYAIDDTVKRWVRRVAAFLLSIPIIYCFYSIAAGYLNLR